MSLYPDDKINNNADNEDKFSQNDEDPDGETNDKPNLLNQRSSKHSQKDVPVRYRLKNDSLGNYLVK